MGFLQARASARATDTPPASFEEFCLRYFGAGFSRHFMIPYNQKLWGAHPSQITASWCQRFVPKPKLEDVVAGAVGLNDRELGYNASFLYPRTGIGELSQAIHRSLERPARLGARVTAVDHRRREITVDGERHPYRALISTMPLDKLVDCLVDPPEQVRELVGRLRCTSLCYLDVGVSEPCRRDLHWIYVPEERYPFYRVGCYSNFSSEMAPPGCSAYYVELADRGEPDLSRLGPEVGQALTDMGLISAPDRVLFMRPRRLEHAYVLYDHAYEKVVPELHRFLGEHGIVSTGRYGAWNYSSMEDALLFGRDAASQIRELA
jgi:protoporphyrinogen oxidase